MRVITWNCNQALRRKVASLLALEPDVAVIQECESSFTPPDGYNFVWHGVNRHKGLGVLARSSVLPLSHPVCDKSALFYPVYLPELDLRLLAVWAFNHRVEHFDPPRTGMALDVIDELTNWLANGRTVVAGDFNNNCRWDKAGKPNRFLDIANSLASLGLTSAYHQETGEGFGTESAMTHFWRKSGTTAYHIDYCFVSKSIGVASSSIPAFDSWRALSDHVPVVIGTK